jgi:hypothetical protein
MGNKNPYTGVGKMNLCNYDWNISLLNVASSVKPKLDSGDSGFDIKIPDRYSSVILVINIFHYFFERVERKDMAGYEVRKKTINGNNLLYNMYTSYAILWEGEKNIDIIYHRNFTINFDVYGFYFINPPFIEIKFLGEKVP